MTDSIPVIVIFAPTASGKTALAVQLFGKSGLSFLSGKAEVISADSMQIYKRLDIGTAKPTEAERAELPHHLIDLLDFHQSYSVSDFVERADQCCREIYGRRRIPIVMGGTGFYIRNFMQGLPATPAGDARIRATLRERLMREGPDALHSELAAVDPESVLKIAPRDAQRLIRALEVFHATGIPRSSFKMNSGNRDAYRFCTVILDRERQELYRRIDQRIEQMFAAGLEQEVRALIARGAVADSPAMKAIGYREWFSGNMESGDGITRIKETIKQNSRRYAKRQITFMRGISGAHHVDADDRAGLLATLQRELGGAL